MIRIKHTFPIPIIRDCGCFIDPDPETDGVIIRQCEQHSAMSYEFEWKLRRVLDLELRQFITRECRPSRRQFGVADFAVAK